MNIKTKVGAFTVCIKNKGWDIYVLKTKVGHFVNLKTKVGHLGI